MNGRWLRSFLAVAQKGGITAAAGELFISPQALHQHFDRIENNRYRIMKSLNRGGICLGNGNISRIFAGYSGVPLEFDNHVQHGLACRKEMYEKYRSFFEAAHEVNAAVEARKNR